MCYRAPEHQDVLYDFTGQGGEGCHDWPWQGVHDGAERAAELPADVQYLQVWLHSYPCVWDLPPERCWHPLCQGEQPLSRVSAPPSQWQLHANICIATRPITPFDSAVCIILIMLRVVVVHNMVSTMWFLDRWCWYWYCHWWLASWAWLHDII